MSDPITWQRERLAKLRERISALEQLQLAPEETTYLNELREQLRAEEARVAEVEQLVNDNPVEPPRAASGGGGGGGARVVTTEARALGKTRGVYEKDWKVVFDYFPGMAASFEEVVALDQREEELFQLMRLQKELIPDWREVRNQVESLWNTVSGQIKARLAMLAQPRRINITFSGHVEDDDSPFRNDTADYIDPFGTTTRFGEVNRYQADFTADEVTLKVNLACRLAVGAADGVALQVQGAGDVYESGDAEGHFDVSVTLEHTQTSGEFRGNVKDGGYATLRVRFDFAP